MDSRGNLISFCHEVQKMLGMEYRAPPLPVDLSGSNFDGGKLSIDGELEERSSANAEIMGKDAAAKIDLFRSVARERHNIRS